jgi:putative ABC transport system ATP-binding protein
VFRLERVSKVYRTRTRRVPVLDNVSLEVGEGEFTVVRGPSGSGKTTLLLTIGGMLRPTNGRVLVDERDIYAMGVRRRARFRAEHVGFVFQMFHLVPYLNVLENVLLPAAVRKDRSARQRAEVLLGRLGLTDRRNHKPSELSIGERQRVALARAMIARPNLILADEPTGNLDPDNAAEVMNHLADFHKKGGSVVVVTHGTSADVYADRVLELKDRRIETAADEKQA